MIKLPDEAPNALVALCQQLYDHKSTGSSVAQDVWEDCLEELRLNATAQPVSDWLKEAERMAELHGMSFVVFRNGGEPKCADPTKVRIEFTDKGLGYPAAPGGQCS